MMPISANRATVAASIVIVAALLCCYGLANSAQEPAPAVKDASRTPPADDMGEQVKDLQKQLTALKSQLSELRSPNMVAAGTATWNRPAVLGNRTSTRVKLKPEIAAKIGKEYIVLLTNRLPVGGYPYFECYWKIADDGFDIYLVDSSIGGLSTASYENRNTSYLIDWVVVKK
jgi:hypothetical protein